MVDEALQHHHEAACPLTKGAVGVLLQEGKQLLPDLGQHSGHVVSGQRVSVVQVHYCIFKVSADGQVGMSRQTTEYLAALDKRRHLRMLSSTCFFYILYQKKVQNQGEKRAKVVSAQMHVCLDLI